MAAFALIRVHWRTLVLNLAFVLLFTVGHSYAYGLEKEGDKHPLPETNMHAEFDGRVRPVPYLAPMPEMDANEPCPLRIRLPQTNPPADARGRYLPFAIVPETLIRF